MMKVVNSVLSGYLAYPSRYLNAPEKKTPKMRKRKTPKTLQKTKKQNFSHIFWTFQNCAVVLAKIEAQHIARIECLSTRLIYCNIVILWYCDTVIIYYSLLDACSEVYKVRWMRVLDFRSFDLLIFRFVFLIFRFFIWMISFLSFVFATSSLHVGVVTSHSRSKEKPSKPIRQFFLLSLKSIFFGI